MPSRQEIFALVLKNVHTVMPHLRGTSIQPSDSLRELGANSIDRADIVIGVMEELALTIPRVELAVPQTLGELVDLIHEKSR